MKEYNSNKKNGYIALGIMIFLAGLIVFGSGPLYKVIDDRTKPDIYTPGTYTGSAKGYGGTVTVKVTVSEKAIEAIDVNGENETLLDMVLPGLTDAIISKQSTDVDSVSGATFSSEAIKEGTDQALAQARGESVPTESAATESAQSEETKTESAESGDYTPGIYTGSAKGYGGEVTTTIKVSADKIESIDVKGEKETLIDKVLPGLTDAIIEKQSTEVDSVSGATFTSKAIKEGAEQALLQARGEGDAAKAAEPENAGAKTYTPGIYTGSEMGYGGMVTAQVKVSENAIESIDVTGEKETHMKMVLPGLTDSIIEKQSTDVDSVSGATLTSKAITGAVDKALSQARGKADTADDAETKSES